MPERVRAARRAGPGAAARRVSAGVPVRAAPERRQEELGRPLALHHGAPVLRQHDDRPVAPCEAHPPRGDAAAQERDEPRFRILAEIPPRLDAGEARALEARIVVAADELDGELQAEPVVHTRGPRERLAHHQRRRLGIDVGALLAERQAHVAAAAAGERLRLVAEIAQDGVVAAAPALDPANQLEKEPPLVLDHGGIRRCASLPRSSSARRSGRSRALTMSSPIAGSPSRPARPTSW